MKVKGENMITSEVFDYIDIALSSQAFRDSELEVLKDVINDYVDNSSTTYNFFEEKIGDKLVGFVIFGKTPLTEYGWDIYWLIVHKMFQGKGVGRRLIQRVEEFVLTMDHKAILRVETSSKKEYSAARGLYVKLNYLELGRLPNFYSESDDLIIFYKEINSPSTDIFLMNCDPIADFH